MKFLFRTPLFDFDPDNESEIRENWQKIIEAISISSPSLAREIRNKGYENLAKPVKLKVKKYILRGRYRSTPFGKLAGVGLGTDMQQKFSIDLSQADELRSDCTIENPESSYEHWRLSVSSLSQFNRRVFLSYLVKEERWALLSIPHNKVISLLENHCNTHLKIRFAEFRSWFKEGSQHYIEEIWRELIKMGILYHSEDWLKTLISPSVYTDVVVKDQLGIQDKIKNILDDFFQTAGNLFGEVSSDYLEGLKKWFHVKFDDRFIPLPFLLNYQEFTSSDFLELIPNGISQKESLEIPDSLWGCEEVDLKQIVKDAPLPSQIYHVDLVVKILDDNSIVVDNALCNRPFVLIGRFNRNEEIYAYEKEIKSLVYPNDGLIYAEVRIFETHVVQGICATRPVFEKYISPFNQENPNCIPFDEIEMGLRDGEFFLVHNKSGKRIIPIITHPLNGKEISHPLIRLLWELEHQKSFNLVHYHAPLFSSKTYTPRLCWGKIIMQSRRWVINSHQFELQNELKKWLVEQALPSNILVGIYDRELLVNWESEDGLEILWLELRKYSMCVVSEVIWKGKSPYASSKGKAIYPQLVISHRKEIKEKPWTGFLNSIDHEDPKWLYLVFWVSEEDFEDSMLLLFSFYLIDFLKRKRVLWYFLVYPDREQIQVRLRFCPNSKEEREEILYHLVNNIQRLRFELRPYYPEVKKYGNTTYLISESLFWMESSLVSEIIRKTVRLSGSSTISTECLSHFWTDLILSTGMETYGFKMLRTRVKRISHESKRRFLAEPNEKNRFKRLPLAWKKDYKEKLMTHLNHWEEEHMKWQIISNHLHMQVNRFYSLDRKIMEDWVYFMLYKEMGRRIFGKGGR